MPFSRLWLFAMVPLFALGVFGVVRLAKGLIRFTREAIVASLPVAPEQSVVLPAAGQYSLLTQGTIGDRTMGDVRFGVAADAGDRAEGRGQLAVRIVALVLTSVLTLVSLVGSILLIAGRVQRG
jgi:hypothetical protein